MQNGKKSGDREEGMQISEKINRKRGIIPKRLGIIGGKEEDNSGIQEREVRMREKRENQEREEKN